MRKAWRYLTIIVILLSIVWLSYKLILDWDIISSSISNLFIKGGGYTIQIIALTILGVIFDTLRWSFMVGDRGRRFNIHLNTVITSITYSNFTLFGIGEHVARVSSNRDESKSSRTIITDSVMISILNTVSIVCISLPFMCREYNVIDGIIDPIYVILVSVCIMIGLCCIKSRWTEDIRVSRVVPSFIFTVIKTLLFYYQFYLLLEFMFSESGVEHELYSLFSITCTYYLIVTLIPLSVGISNLAVRAGVVSILFTSDIEISIGISASICIWFFNIAIISLMYIITMLFNYLIRRREN